MATAASCYPSPDLGVITEFLGEYVGEAIQLVAIKPTLAPVARWFGDEAGPAARWAALQNESGAGVYWSVNVCREGLSKKAAKQDIEAARFAHVDIDPPNDVETWSVDEALRRLQDHPFAPSFVIFTGGGLGAYWRLERVIAPASVEPINEGIAETFAGDNCSNHDRLMRLPGTVNWPNASKSLRGRSPTLATILQVDNGVTHSSFVLEATFVRRAQSALVKAGAQADIGLLTADNLGLALSHPLRKLIERPRGLDRSKDLLACVGRMVREKYSDDQIVGVLLNPANPVAAHIRDQPHPLRAVHRCISVARSGKTRSRHDSLLADPAQVCAEGTQIVLAAGELHTAASQVEDALIGANAPIFVRGGLVRPVLEEVPASGGRRLKVARLKQFTADMLIDQISRSAELVKWNVRIGGHVRTDPTVQLASIILSRDGEWKFPTLAGVITTPTLRPDGTILCDAGYDPQTQLLLLEPPQLPPIPAQPTRDDALVAVHLLEELLDEFPFVDEASKAAALSGLITPVVRGAMDVAPMHVGSGTTPGSGKSYYVDLCAVIATGERAPVISAGKTEEETEKRLGAALLAGQPIISIDNVNGDLGGDQLCQMIERPVVAIRPLGKSALINIASRATTFATGNNIRLVGDMTRRVVVCSLDPNIERPELRNFKSNPLDAILADRAKYVGAALTIARAYAVADFPNLTKLPSFEGWSRYVRSPLIWLGYADPIETMEKARAEDPVMSALAPILHAWHEALGSSSQKAGDIKQEAEQADARGALRHSQLYEALMEVAEGRTGGIDTKRLGKFLGRHDGRIANGLKLVGGNDAHMGQRVWKVIKQ